MSFPLVSILLCVGMAACEDTRTSGKAATTSDVSGWVAKGPSAWAEHLGPEAVLDDDGFLALARLATWLVSNPPPAKDEVDSSRSLAWAQAYTKMVKDIADQPRWSVRTIIDKDLWAAFGKSQAIIGITDGQTRVLHEQLIDLSHAGIAALRILIREGQLGEAEYLARRLFVVGERIGQDGADRDTIIWTLQLYIGAHAAESFAIIAEKREDMQAAQRYRQIEEGIEEYGKRLVERLRGGP
ncbi:MAG: hypothetical protein IID31_09645 [Planctomycetes bacterium]|nr:hypothetical protein [Planctomycetota bacterium]